MKLFHGRLMTYISATIAAVLFILMGVAVLMNWNFNSYIDEDSTSIDGVYSIDGGDWKQTVSGAVPHEGFRELTIRGKLAKPISDHEMLIMSVNNVWFRLKADGVVVATNYRADDDAFRNTPGFSICYVSSVDISSDSDFELYLMYPYDMISNRDLDDFFDMYRGTPATAYELLFYHKGLTILFCILICFFGLFAFPIAGIVLGQINTRYLTFAFFCFFAGQFILAQSIYSYLPLWITDPISSFTVCYLTTYFCLISALVYIKACLKRTVNKIIGNIIIISSVILTVISLTLHFTGISDLYAAKPFMLIFSGVCAVILAVCMITEVRQDRDRETLMMITSLIPIVLGFVLDAVNDLFPFTDVSIFETGMALTLLNQIAVLIIDMKRQYKETLRYQQMQKELYEAKVSVMVSQIQPHFLYNSLTSIAMMCTKDPQTAKKATINFADYLRGNMNSLKQKAPVPFPQELEHLKKYLMLEQLRFRELLNIEYDIQTTDFSIPLLTVQPLVENAVKHGVGMKEDGGTVTIATRETEDAYEVIVSDDGVGFDTSKPIEDDGRSHVGMENVRRRLKDLSNADLIIESTVGVGTTATIHIPKTTEGTS